MKMKIQGAILLLAFLLGGTVEGGLIPEGSSSGQHSVGSGSGSGRASGQGASSSSSSSRTALYNAANANGGRWQYPPNNPNHHHNHHHHNHHHGEGHHQQMMKRLAFQQKHDARYTYSYPYQSQGRLDFMSKETDMVMDYEVTANIADDLAREWKTRNKDSMDTASTSHLNRDLTAIPVVVTKPSNTGTRMAYAMRHGSVSPVSSQPVPHDGLDQEAAVENMESLAKEWTELNGEPHKTMSSFTFNRKQENPTSQSTSKQQTIKPLQIMSTTAAGVPKAVSPQDLAQEWTDRNREEDDKDGLAHRAPGSSSTAARGSFTPGPGPRSRMMMMSPSPRMSTVPNTSARWTTGTSMDTASTFTSTATTYGIGPAATPPTPKQQAFQRMMQSTGDLALEWAARNRDPQSTASRWSSDVQRGALDTSPQPPSPLRASQERKQQEQKAAAPTPPQATATTTAAVSRSAQPPVTTPQLQEDHATKLAQEWKSVNRDHHQNHVTKNEFLPTPPIEAPSLEVLQDVPQVDDAVAPPVAVPVEEAPETFVGDAPPVVEPATLSDPGPLVDEKISNESKMEASNHDSSSSDSDNWTAKARDDIKAAVASDPDLDKEQVEEDFDEIEALVSKLNQVNKQIHTLKGHETTPPVSLPKTLEKLKTSQPPVDAAATPPEKATSGVGSFIAASMVSGDGGGSCVETANHEQSAWSRVVNDPNSGHFKANKKEKARATTDDEDLVRALEDYPVSHFDAPKETAISSKDNDSSPVQDVATSASDAANTMAPDWVVARMESESPDTVLPKKDTASASLDSLNGVSLGGPIASTSSLPDWVVASMQDHPGTATDSEADTASAVSSANYAADTAKSSNSQQAPGQKYPKPDWLLGTESMPRSAVKSSSTTDSSSSVPDWVTGGVSVLGDQPVTEGWTSAAPLASNPDEIMIGVSPIEPTVTLTESKTSATQEAKPFVITGLSERPPISTQTPSPSIAPGSFGAAPVASATTGNVPAWVTGVTTDSSVTEGWTLAAPLANPGDHTTEGSSAETTGSTKAERVSMDKVASTPKTISTARASKVDTQSTRTKRIFPAQTRWDVEPMSTSPSKAVFSTSPPRWATRNLNEKSTTSASTSAQRSPLPTPTTVSNKRDAPSTRTSAYSKKVPAVAEQGDHKPRISLIALEETTSAVTAKDNKAWGFEAQQQALSATQKKANTRAAVVAPPADGRRAKRSVKRRASATTFSATSTGGSFAVSAATFSRPRSMKGIKKPMSTSKPSRPASTTANAAAANTAIPQAHVAPTPKSSPKKSIPVQKAANAHPTTKSPPKQTIPEQKAANAAPTTKSPPKQTIPEQKTANAAPTTKSPPRKTMAVQRAAQVAPTTKSRPPSRKTIPVQKASRDASKPYGTSKKTLATSLTAKAFDAWIKYKDVTATDVSLLEPKKIEPRDITAAEAGSFATATKLARRWANGLRKVEKEEPSTASDVSETTTSTTARERTASTASPLEMAKATTVEKTPVLFTAAPLLEMKTSKKLASVATIAKKFEKSMLEPPKPWTLPRNKGPSFPTDILNDKEEVKRAFMAGGIVSVIVATVAAETLLDMSVPSLSAPVNMKVVSTGDEVVVSSVEDSSASSALKKEQSVVSPMAGAASGEVFIPRLLDGRYMMEGSTSSEDAVIEAKKQVLSSSPRITMDATKSMLPKAEMVEERAFVPRLLHDASLWE